MVLEEPVGAVGIDVGRVVVGVGAGAEGGARGVVVGQAQQLDRRQGAVGRLELAYGMGLRTTVAQGVERFGVAAASGKVAYTGRGPDWGFAHPPASA